MFIVYIVFGVAAGLIAATVTFVSGAGYLAVLFAYVLVGMFGMLGGLVWANSPNFSKPFKHALTQRD